jgi:adenylate kinase
MRIVFLGPPGAGKGTQAQRLKDYLGVAHLSTGELLRAAGEAATPLGREALRSMQAGRLVPDEVVVGIVAERLAAADCIPGCLFDGFPRTVQQAEELDRMLAQRDIPIDLVLALAVSEDQLVKRLLLRGRMDDNRATIRERFRQYNELTEPLLDYYRRRGILRMIDGEGTPDEVFQRILEVIDSAADSTIRRLA